MEETINEAFVTRKGGVPWAKRFAATLNPDRIFYQVHEYETALAQATDLLDGLLKFQVCRPSMWTGSAAEAASAKVAEAVNFAQALMEALQTTATALDSVYEYAGNAQTGIAQAPDQSHQATLLTCTDHLKSLESSYTTAATQLHTVHAPTAPSPSTRPSNLPAASPPPAPAANQPNSPNGDNGRTQLAGAGAAACPPPELTGGSGTPPSTTVHTVANPLVLGIAPSFVAPGLSVPDVGASDDSPDLVPAPPQPEATSSERGLFGDDGFEDARMLAPGLSSVSGDVLDDAGTARSRSALSGHGLFTDDEENSAHPRQWLGLVDDEEEGEDGEPRWTAPAIGGDESLLPVCRTAAAGRGRVVSVYDHSAVERERSKRSGTLRRL